MKFAIIIFLAFFSICSHGAAVNPLKTPVWSDLEKYKSLTVENIPFLDQDYIAFAGLHYGFKNGIGVDAMACKKLSRYLCGGARFFIGSLNSDAIVRPPAYNETAPITSDYSTILVTPESWFSFVPEIGFTVNTQIIPLDDGLWSESAWFGFGKAYIGGRSGWAISFEPGINKLFASNSKFGWAFKAKYTFGWLYPNNSDPGTIPYDWLNLTAGILYVW